VRFWDSSALVALHVEQTHTSALRRAYDEDPLVLAWLLSDVEIRSALCRMGRDGRMSGEDLGEATTRVESFWKGVHVVTVVDAAKVRAKRLLEVHPLSAGDALQLGAALAVAVDDPLEWEFVTLDARLATAARREGFAVIPA